MSPTLSLLPLKEDWAERDTVDIAIDLIGKVLLRKDKELIGRIVETEAYLGADDPACHTFQGRRTPRTEPMYGRAGNAYVYFIYGMYFCLNVVTGNGEAVLIRALEPVHGFSEEDRKRKVLSGPGRLCRALGIDKQLNNHFLLTEKSPFYLADSQTTDSDSEILSGPRVGISSSGDAAFWPLRYGLKNSPYLSKPYF